MTVDVILGMLLDLNQSNSYSGKIQTPFEIEVIFDTFTFTNR